MSHFASNELEREFSTEAWSMNFVEMKGMFLRTSSVEAAILWGVQVILILGAW